MRVLAALDAFKGALDQVAASKAVARGFVNGYGAGITVDVCPLADGGEGSSLLFLQGGGERQNLVVEDAYGQPRQAFWVLRQGVALIESAQGSPYVAASERPSTVRQTTSRGTGQLMAAALNDSRVREVWVALGGTGSMDGGIGLLSELGYRFFDSERNWLEPCVSSWERVRFVERPLVMKPVVGLCDVLVPLLGERGAVQGFGPQKGLPGADMAEMERQMGAFAEAVSPECAGVPGAGAAGGMGFALAASGARLEPGASWWAQWSDLDAWVKEADLVVTGEGRLDEQSLYGKVLSVVLAAGKRHRRPVIALAGQIPVDLEPFYREGLCLALAIGTGSDDMISALARTEMRLEATAETLGRFMAETRNLT